MPVHPLSSDPCELGCTNGTTNILSRMKPGDFVFFRVEIPSERQKYSRRILKRRTQCVRQLARQLRQRTHGAQNWRQSTFLVSKIDDLNEISVYRTQ